jgi:hypothetical protein
MDPAQREPCEGGFGHRETGRGGQGPAPLQWVVHRGRDCVEVAAGDGEEEPKGCRQGGSAARNE